MAHNTSHRRNLAAPHPHHTPMDPTTTAAANNNNNHRRRYHHPIPDPTTTAAAAPPPPPSTIQNISHRFSKLYSNHKKLVTKPQHPHPHPEPETHTTTTTTLTKSSSHHERRNTTTTAAAEKDHYYLGTKTKAANEKDGPKKTVPKKDPQKRSSFDAQLMNEDVKMVGRSSVSSIPPPMANGGGGRRRSFCSSQVELADFFSATGVRVVAVDMPPFMQIHAVDCARKAHDSLEKFTSKTLAFTLKKVDSQILCFHALSYLPDKLLIGSSKEFDGVYGPAWHCIVGTSFGSFVTHSVGGFMYFSMDHKIYILLFKTTVQRAQELN
ncbi:hypothetical protein ABFS82_09G031300 [Erythranthe guttata]